MIYRKAEPSELPMIEERLKQLLPIKGHLTPDNCLIICAFEGDQLVAFWPAMTAIHCDGLWVDPNFRGQVFLPRLGKAMDEELRKLKIPEYFTFPSSPEVERLAELTGQRRLHHSVYGKEL